MGYLLGSVSFARIVGGLAAPGTDVTRVDLTFDDGSSYESRAASASAVRAKAGTRWGVLTGFLDAAKVAVPILVARALDLPLDAQVAIALGGLVGHILPVYHRFRGGLGESATYGALLVFDPIGVVVATALATVAGFATGSVIVLREMGVVFFAVWSVVVRDEPLLAGYALVATVVYHLAALPESRRKRGVRRGRARLSNEEVSREFGMGTAPGRAIDRWGLPGLVRRLAGRTS